MGPDGFIPLETIVNFNRMQHLVSYAYYLVTGNTSTTNTQQSKTETLNVDPQTNSYAADQLSTVDSSSPFVPIDIEWSHQFVLSCIADSEVVESMTDPISQTTSVRLREDWDKWLLLPQTVPVQQFNILNTQTETPLTENTTVEKKDISDNSITTDPNPQEKDNNWEKARKRHTKKLSSLESPHTSSEITLTMNDDDLFQFDESYDRDRDQENDNTYEASEFEDDELDSILLVTQRPAASESAKSQSGLYHNMPHRKHATSPFIRSKSDVDIADMISEGLYLYEKSFGKQKRAPGIGELGKVGTVTEDTFLKVKSPGTSSPRISNSLLSTSQSSPRPKNLAVLGKRFFEGGQNSASPPIGWFLDKRMGRSIPRNSLSTSCEHAGAFSLNSNSSVHNAASSYGGAASSYGFSFKELTPFQHPSYELLQENGFIQQKYSKYHSRAIRGDSLY